MILAVISLLYLSWTVYDHLEHYDYLGDQGFWFIKSVLAFLIPLFTLGLCLIPDKKNYKNYYLTLSVIGLILALISPLLSGYSDAFFGSHFSLGFSGYYFPPTFILSIALLIFYFYIPKDTDTVPSTTFSREEIITENQNVSSSSVTASIRTNTTPPPFPSEPRSTESTYYVALNGKQMGPYDLDKMKVLIEVGQLVMNTQVWKEGMADWDEAHTVPELIELFK